MGKVGDGNIIHILMLLQLVLLASVIAVSEGSIFKRPKRHVHVINSLELNRIMTVNCHSGDDDLGVHEVPYGGEFQFEFYPNIFGTTKFFCTLHWRDIVKSVVVYDAKSSDFERCVNNCYWRVNLDQICTWGDAGPDKTVCTPWK